MSLSDSARALIQKKIREATGLEVRVACNDDTGDIELRKLVKVTRKAVGNNQIDLFDARMTNPKAKIGDYIEFPLEESSMMSQIINESLQVSAKAEAAYRHKAELLEELKVNGIIEYSLIFPTFKYESLIGDAYFLLDGKYEVRLAKDKRMPEDKFIEGESYPMIILTFEERQNVVLIQASRVTNSLVEELIRMSLVNCAASVHIHKVARDPGKVAKVVVSCDDPKYNASALVVGFKGSRVKVVDSYLGNEKIEVANYAPNTPLQIYELLGPKNVVDIYYYFENPEHFKTMKSVNRKKAMVVVKDECVSKIIGKGGTSLCLSNKILGWVLQIVSVTDFNQRFPYGFVTPEIAKLEEFDWAGVEFTYPCEQRYFAHYLKDVGAESLTDCSDWQSDALDCQLDLSQDDKSFFFGQLDQLEFVVTCPTCGEQVPSSEDVCPNCGSSLVIS